MSEGLVPVEAGDEAARFRLAVVDHALRLFAEQGYEATSVDAIAAAAGISRRTFFRQFGSKEDVVFADHEAQLAWAREFLAGAAGDPWDAVCEAIVGLFERFTQTRELAARRYRVVREEPTLRDREIVTVFRYERLFTEFLRERRPDVADLRLIQFTAAVTATHNYLLRRMLRGLAEAGPADLRAALAAVPRGPADELVVAVVPGNMSPRRVADLLAERLGNL